VLDYSITGGQISIEEYVGVSAPLLNQVASTWEALSPALATWDIRSKIRG
jgi:DNA-binding transcriptional regulator YdaS (Cro superfamily)